MQEVLLPGNVPVWIAVPQHQGIDGEQVQTGANNPMPVTMAGGIGQGSLYGEKTVGATATAIRIGSSDLAGRQSVLIVNNDPENDIFVGFDNAVTTANGIPVYAGQERLFKVSNITLYAIASTPTSVRVAEIK
ncbi:hypothetical protein EV213_108190 [Aureibacillus halotolerans]|uniref:Uncharacterized protein n=2 Tax=Aureibacillus halotolerans TaxID=1508390 RepID=A0A4R6TZ32_9BACI|nr:hypothetical protein EV213_108190 [Aureibacillus halotolerans]